MRHRPSLVVLALVFVTSSASAVPVLTGRVLDSSDGVAAAALTVVPWTEETSPPGARTCQVGQGRSDGFFLDLTTWIWSGRDQSWTAKVETSVSDPQGPFGVSGYFAVSRGSVHAPQVMTLPA